MTVTKFRGRALSGTDVLKFVTLSRLALALGPASFISAPDVTVAEAGVVDFDLLPNILREVSRCILSEWAMYCRAVLSLRQLNNSCKRMNQF